jgi:hypothetical protein
MPDSAEECSISRERLLQQPRKSSEFELHHNPLSGIAKGDATKSSAWTKAYTDEGIEYFHNTATGETSWEPPSQGPRDVV